MWEIQDRVGFDGSLIFMRALMKADEATMKRRAVDPVRGLLLIALLLAGMGLATLWRRWGSVIAGRQLRGGVSDRGRAHAFDGARRRVSGAGAVAAAAGTPK
jgi:hypothetical protein